MFCVRKDRLIAQRDHFDKSPLARMIAHFHLRILIRCSLCALLSMRVPTHRCSKIFRFSLKTYLSVSTVFELLSRDVIRGKVAGRYHFVQG